MCWVIGLIFDELSLETVGGNLGSIGVIGLFVGMFVWGCGAIKEVFGIGSVGAIFSGNVVIGTVIFVVCLLAAYFISVVVAFIGIGRYIYLKVKVAQERR